MTTEGGKVPKLNRSAEARVMARLSRYRALEPQTIVITHYRVVSDTENAIRFSVSDREADGKGRALERAQNWLADGWHIEIWEQTYTVSPSTWKRVLD